MSDNSSRENVDSPDQSDPKGVFRNPRFTRHTLNLIGSECDVVCKDKVIKGIFRAINEQMSVVVGAATEKPEKKDDIISRGNMNIVYTGKENMSDQLIFQSSQYRYVKFNNVQLMDGEDTTSPNGESASKGNAPQSNGGKTEPKPTKVFQSFFESGDADAEDDALDINLNDENPGWGPEEMFQANTDNHNYKSTYDPNLHQYTTPLLETDTPEFNRRKQRATKLANSIENSSNYQRNIDREVCDNVTEEEKFSSVEPCEGQAPRIPPSSSASKKPSCEELMGRYGSNSQQQQPDQHQIRTTGMRPGADRRYGTKDTAYTSIHARQQQQQQHQQQHGPTTGIYRPTQQQQGQETGGVRLLRSNGGGQQNQRYNKVHNNDMRYSTYQHNEANRYEPLMVKGARGSNERNYNRGAGSSGMPARYNKDGGMQRQYSNESSSRSMSRTSSTSSSHHQQQMDGGAGGDYNRMHNMHKQDESSHHDETLTTAATTTSAPPAITPGCVATSPPAENFASMSLNGFPPKTAGGAYPSMRGAGPSKKKETGNKVDDLKKFGKNFILQSEGQVKSQAHGSAISTTPNTTAAASTVAAVSLPQANNVPPVISCNSGNVVLKNTSATYHNVGRGSHDGGAPMLTDPYQQQQPPPPMIMATTQHQQQQSTPPMNKRVVSHQQQQRHVPPPQQQQQQRQQQAAYGDLQQQRVYAIADMQQQPPPHHHRAPNPAGAAIVPHQPAGMMVPHFMPPHMPHVYHPIPATNPMPPQQQQQPPRKDMKPPQQASKPQPAINIPSSSNAIPIKMTQVNTFSAASAYTNPPTTAASVQQPATVKQVESPVKPAEVAPAADEEKNEQAVEQAVSPTPSSSSSAKKDLQLNPNAKEFVPAGKPPPTTSVATPSSSQPVTAAPAIATTPKHLKRGDNIAQAMVSPSAGEVQPPPQQQQVMNFPVSYVSMQPVHNNSAPFRPLPAPQGQQYVIQPPAPNHQMIHHHQPIVHMELGGYQTNPNCMPVRNQPAAAATYQATDGNFYSYVSPNQQAAQQQQNPQQAAYIQQRPPSVHNPTHLGQLPPQAGGAGGPGNPQAQGQMPPPQQQQQQPMHHHQGNQQPPPQQQQQQQQASFVAQQPAAFYNPQMMPHLSQVAPNGSPAAIIPNSNQPIYQPIGNQAMYLVGPGARSHPHNPTAATHHHHPHHHHAAHVVHQQHQQNYLQQQPNNPQPAPQGPPQPGYIQQQHAQNNWNGPQNYPTSQH